MSALTDWVSHWPRCKTCKDFRKKKQSARASRKAFHELPSCKVGRRLYMRYLGMDGNYTGKTGTGRSGGFGSRRAK